MKFKAYNKTTTYEYDTASADILDKIPAKDTGMSVHFKTKEFTTLCPVSGQPDYGTVMITYYPKKWYVETKSLKLYLISYRQYEISNEKCADKIMNDLSKLLIPAYLSVRIKFGSRGGIVTDVESHYDPEVTEILEKEEANEI